MRPYQEVNEWAVQYHPPADDNISYHPYCLHLWRPQLADMPVPPREFVGPVGPEN